MRQQFGTATERGALLPYLDAGRSCALLEQLIEVVRVERGWSRDRASEAFGRDVGRGAAARAFPTLETVIRVADEIGWSAGTLAELLISQEPATELREWCGPDDFASMICASTYAIMKDGRTVDGVRLAMRAYRYATRPVDKAFALSRAIGGLDLLGRYQEALVIARMAAALDPLPAGMRQCAEANLAYIHSVLGNNCEALALTDGLLAESRADDLGKPNGILNRGFALLVNAEVHRKMIAMDAVPDVRHAERAVRSYESAIAHFMEMRGCSHPSGNSHSRGLAVRAIGGLIESRVVTQSISADAALDHFGRKISPLADLEGREVTPILRGHGWCCIYACNVAMRHQTGPARDRNLAVFSNKASEIAEHASDWAMREAVFTIEYLRRERQIRPAGRRGHWIMDRDDVRDLAGSIARFPRFRRFGIEIYRSAALVR